MRGFWPSALTMASVAMFGKTLADAVQTLPVAEVKKVREVPAKTYSARVDSVAEVDVRPQVTGETLKVGFANGQVVAKGDVLYQLDSVQCRAAVKNAEAKIAELKANLTYSIANFTLMFPTSITGMGGVVAYLLALAVIFFASGVGAASQKALAVTVFSGVVAALTTGLLFAPALYCLVAARKRTTPFC